MQPKKNEINQTSSKLKIFVHQRTLSRKRKGNPQNGRKYWQIIYLIKVSHPEYIKNSSNNKMTTQLKKEWQFWTGISPKKMYKQSISTWKKYATLLVTGKCQSKPLRWLQPKRQTITSVGKAAEKLEHPRGAGVQGGSCSGKVWWLLKRLNAELP